VRGTIKKKKRLPHYEVYARLAPSKVHGVGVFAISHIPKGTYVFWGDDDKLVWVRKGQLKGLPLSIQKLYRDFCVMKNHGKEYGCPKNFNLLTLAWYLNDSRRPNLKCDKSYRFFALRNIKAGEELTADYREYNQFK
jgi:uncharacterized protein